MDADKNSKLPQETSPLIIEKLPIKALAGISEIPISTIPNYIELLCYSNINSAQLESIEELLAFSTVDKLKSLREELSSLIAEGRACGSHSEPSWVALYSSDAYKELFKLTGCDKVETPLDFTIKLLLTLQSYLRVLKLPQYTFVPPEVWKAGTIFLQNEISKNSSVHRFLVSEDGSTLDVSNNSARRILSELETFRIDFEQDGVMKTRWKLHPNYLNNWFRELGICSLIHPVDILSKLYSELSLLVHGKQHEIKLEALDQEMLEHRKLAKQIFRNIFMDGVFAVVETGGSGIRTFSGEVENKGPI